MSTGHRRVLCCSGHLVVSDCMLILRCESPLLIDVVTVVQVEAAIYNERERCYDDFSNLFRQFDEANRSDLDGSRTEEFWPKLSSMRDRVSCRAYKWFQQTC